MITIKAIRCRIRSLIGKKIKIIYYGSRHKKEIYNGYILKLYHNVFTICLICGGIRCFSYSDVLVKNVKIMY